MSLTPCRWCNDLVDHDHIVFHEGHNKCLGCLMDPKRGRLRSSRLTGSDFGEGLKVMQPPALAGESRPESD